MENHIQYKGIDKAKVSITTYSYKTDK